MASRLRVLLLVVGLVFLGALGLQLALRLRQPMRASREPIALVWDVPDDIDEAPPAGSSFSLGALRRDRPSLYEIAAAVRHAASDDHVRALVLHVGEVGWGWARIAEFRAALAEFRAAGKPVWVSLEGGSDASYLLAASGSTVAMPPTAAVFLDGLTASAMFLKGTYDKLGITPNYAFVGQFKSAVEQYTRTSLSEPARTAMEALLDDEFVQLVDSLAAARHVSPERVRAMIDDGPYSASRARAAGLVDTLMDTADVDSLAAGRGGAHRTLTGLARYADDLDLGGTDEPVAVVAASGTIVSGRSRDNGWGGAEIGSGTLSRTLRELRERRSVRAVVLRLDSPGGSGQASDEVWQEIQRLRRRKPVVVSMSNLAASGGYYIACAASRIVAEPGTITGSIGVFGGKLNLLGLYRKLGLNIETVSRGRHAEMLSPFKDFSPEEAARFQGQLDEFYRTFLARVAQGRGMSTERVDTLAQGRVWSGAAARRFGLVDTLGGLSVAIALARREAGLPAVGEEGVMLYPPPRRPYFRRFISDLIDESGDAALPPAFPAVLEAWLTASRFPTGTAMAMLPYSIDIR